MPMPRLFLVTYRNLLVNPPSPNNFCSLKFFANFHKGRSKRKKNQTRSSFFRCGRKRPFRTHRGVRVANFFIYTNFARIFFTQAQYVPKNKIFRQILPWPAPMLRLRPGSGSKRVFRYILYSTWKWCGSATDLLLSFYNFFTQTTWLPPELGYVENILFAPILRLQPDLGSGALCRYSW
jgi:hypothetical protein